MATSPRREQGFLSQDLRFLPDRHPRFNSFTRNLHHRLQSFDLFIGCWSHWDWFFRRLWEFCQRRGCGCSTAGNKNLRTTPVTKSTSLRHKGTAPGAIRFKLEWHWSGICFFNCRLTCNRAGFNDLFHRRDFFWLLWSCKSSPPLHPAGPWMTVSLQFWGRIFSWIWESARCRDYLTDNLLKRRGCIVLYRFQPYIPVLYCFLLSGARR